MFVRLTAAHCSGQITHKARVHAVAVDQTGHLDAGVARQIGDQPGVKHIAMNAVRHVAEHRLNDIGRKLVSFLMFDMAVSEQAVPHFVPALDLLNTTPGVFIQRDFEAFNKLRVFFFDKIRRVFGCVLARFGHIVAEPPHDLQTHQVFALFVVLRRKGTALDLWIQIVALKVLDFQQPGLVIDTGDLPAAAIGIFAHIQPLEQPLGAALHRMAQPTVRIPVYRCI